MHIKRAFAGTADNDEPLAHLIRPGERVKTAGQMLPEVQAFIDTLEPDPRYTYVLVNAMGNSWYYGANSNRDWYGYNPHLDFDGLLHAWDGIGKDYEADRMKAKAWPYGYPCFLNSTVYAHHKNTDPQQLGFGDVLFAAHNPVMKRIELVERVFNDEAKKKGHTSILDRIAAGERVDVSMGTKVPFDLCSVCTDWEEVKRAWKTFDPEKHAHPGISILTYHKTKPIKGLAITRKDYCRCMKETPGRILPDGKKVFVYNDFCRFFDISFVIVGADRTARVMWHLAGEKPAQKPRSQISLSALLSALTAKTAGVRIAMDKQIPGGFAQAIQQDSANAPDLSETLDRAYDSHPDARRILSMLAVFGIIPSPKEFQRLVLRDMPGGEKISELLDSKHAVFDTDVGGVDDTYSVNPALYDEDLAKQLVAEVVKRSSWDPFLTQRLVNPVQNKTAGAEPRPLRTPLLDKIAAQYNGFRISVLESAADLLPKTAGALSFLGSTGKGIGAAALLLGLGPMISLLSSHLRSGREEGQQIGTMASLVADNPSFVTITTIGAGLRAAMEVEKAGGLVSTIRSIVASAKGVL